MKIEFELYGSDVDHLKLLADHYGYGNPNAFVRNVILDYLDHGKLRNSLFESECERDA